jgi:hypothetical protein
MTHIPIFLLETLVFYFGVKICHHSLMRRSQKGGFAKGGAFIPHREAFPPRPFRIAEQSRTDCTVQLIVDLGEKGVRPHRSGQSCAKATVSAEFAAFRETKSSWFQGEQRRPGEPREALLPNQ